MRTVSPIALAWPLDTALVLPVPMNDWDQGRGGREGGCGRIGPGEEDHGTLRPHVRDILYPHYLEPDPPRAAVVPVLRWQFDLCRAPTSAGQLCGDRFAPIRQNPRSDMFRGAMIARRASAHGHRFGIAPSSITPSWWTRQDEDCLLENLGTAIVADGADLPVLEPVLSSMSTRDSWLRRSCHDPEVVPHTPEIRA